MKRRHDGDAPRLDSDQTGTVRGGVEPVVEASGRHRWDKLFRVVGRYGNGRSPGDVGREHDRYLDEIYGT